MLKKAGVIILVVLIAVSSYLWIATFQKVDTKSFGFVSIALASPGAEDIYNWSLGEPTIAIEPSATNINYNWSLGKPTVILKYVAAEPAAEVVPTIWEVGIIAVNTTANTAINTFTVTNTGDGAIDMEIRGTDLTGGDDTWDLADDGSPGENIFGLYAGLDDDDDLFDIIIKEDAAYNTLVAGLAEDATQDWGMKLYMPTSITDYDGQEMTCTVTLIVSAS